VCAVAVHDRRGNGSVSGRSRGARQKEQDSKPHNRQLANIS